MPWPPPPVRDRDARGPRYPSWHSHRRRQAVDEARGWLPRAGVGDRSATRRPRERTSRVTLDVLLCPRCGGRMSVIATIEADVLRKILYHLRLPSERPIPLPSRSPPSFGDLFPDALTGSSADSPARSAVWREVRPKRTAVRAFDDSTRSRDRVLREFESVLGDDRSRASQET